MKWVARLCSLSQLGLVVILSAACADLGSNDPSQVPTDIGSEPDAEAPPPDSSAIDIPVITDPGKDAYDRLCSGCHGAGDDAGLGTTLAPPIRFPSRGYAGHVVRAGRDEMATFAIAMPAFDATALPDDTLVALFDYLDDFEKPTDGGELFVLFCANCHGADAKGGRVSKGIRSNGSGDYAEKVRRGEGGTTYGSRTNYMPSWGSDVLSKNDINAIVAYVKSL